MNVKFLAVISILAIVLTTVFFLSNSPKAATKCLSLQIVRGFVSVRSDPPFLVGTIPSSFTSDERFFSNRFNCTGNSAKIRRVDTGTYDVQFPGLNDRPALVTVISLEGAFASVKNLTDGIYRVTIRGPVVDGPIIPRRDIPFTIVLH